MCPLDWFFIQVVGEKGESVEWNERPTGEIVFWFYTKGMGKHLLFLIRVKSCTFLDIPTGTDVCTYLRQSNSIMYLWLFSFHGLCSLKNQCNKSVNSKSEEFCVIWHNYMKVPDFSLFSPGALRTDDQKQMAQSLAKESKTHSELGPNKYPRLLCGFQQSRYFQDNSNEDFLDAKILTNSRSSHLLLYSSFHSVIAKNWQLNSIDSEYSGSIWPPTLELRRR